MPLTTSSPSHARIDAQGIIDFLDAAAHLDLHSIAIARDGQTIARGWWAPYSAQQRHLLYSCSKSVTASTVAALVGDGLFGLDDAVLDLLPAEAVAGAGEVAQVWRRVTVRHCLTMTIGHTYDAWPSFTWRDEQEPLHTLLGNPPDAEPGSVFAYNQVCTYLLSRVVEQITSRPLDEVAMTRVLSRIGVPSIDWEHDGAGHPLGFTGARLRTDDLLALTQLWLDRGRVGDDQIINATFFDVATTDVMGVEPNPTSDWQGYGHSFWIARHGFRADGAYGQYGIVLPEQRVVIAMTTEVADLQEPLDLLWQHVLPAIDRPGSAEADARLDERLAALAIPALASSQPAAGIRSWSVDPSSDLGEAYSHVRLDGDSLVLVRDGLDLMIMVGDGVWASSEIVADAAHLPVVASGGWTEHGYQAEIRVIETPHSFRVDAGVNGVARLRWQQVPLRGVDPMSQAVR